jgi:hypothetical protein
MKRAASWFLCVALVLLSGCAMFGDTRLYTGLLGLCARCHAPGDAPDAANVKPAFKPAPGATGPQSKAEGCATRCTFTMSH